MKRIIISALCTLGVILLIIAVGALRQRAPEPQLPRNSETVCSPETEAPTVPPTEPPTQPPTETPTEGTTEPEGPPAPLSMQNALMIGDSRTVGLSQFSGMDCDYFATVGMNVYQVQKEAVAVPGVGTVTLGQLLQQKHYDSIYLMLGINELGYDMDQTVKVYRSLVEQLQSLQPETNIFLQANLHVSARRSAGSSYITNANIDTFNSRIAQLADGQFVFYLDANVLFDNGDSVLDPELTFDGVHLEAECYETWASWLAQQSANAVAGWTDAVGGADSVG